MTVYMQADLSYLTTYCRQAKLPLIRTEKLVTIDKAALLAGVTVCKALTCLDVLVPPEGLALVHPASIIRYLRKSNKAKLRKIQKELYQCYELITSSSGEPKLATSGGRLTSTTCCPLIEAK